MQTRHSRSSPSAHGIVGCTVESLEARRLLAANLVHDIVPEGSSNPNLFLSNSANTVLYFTAADNDHGRELWKTDGTSEGTKLVKDLTPGRESTDLYSMASIGDRMLLLVQSSDALQLWSTDGSAAATVNLRSFPRASEDHPTDLEVIPGMLLFTAGESSNELWKSDGTAGGTERIGAGLIPDAPIISLRRAGEFVYFGGTDPGESGQPILWRTDGTTAGTERVFTFPHGANAAPPSQLTASGERLYFIRGNQYSTGELWRTDGTAHSTVRIREGFGPPTHMEGLDGNLIYDTGFGLNVSDGTPLSSVRLKDVTLKPDRYDDFPNYEGFVRSGDYLYFSGSDAAFDSSGELWRTDGTAAGTIPLGDFSGDAGWSPRRLTDVDGTLYFAADGPDGTQLWRSDGTAAGTQVVSEVAPQHRAHAFDIYQLGRKLLFTHDDGVHGRELWAYDPNRGSISGYLFLDPGRTGGRGAGSRPLGNWRVFIDSDHNGRLDPGERTSTSDHLGFYQFANLRPGTYDVRLADLSEEAEVTTDDVRRFKVREGWELSADFGVTADLRPATVRGTVFLDWDRDRRRDEGEPVLPNFRLRLESTGVNAGTQVTRSGPDGSFEFTGVAAGTARLQMSPVRGWTSHPILDNGIELAGGEIATADFGAFPMQRVHGIIYDDRNGNGLRDAGEPPLRHRALSYRYTHSYGYGYEPSPLPKIQADRRGAYEVYLGEGSFGWTFSPGLGLRATPSSIGGSTSPGAVLRQNIGITDLARISGTLFEDGNADGKLTSTADRRLAGWRVYLDLDDNGRFDRGEPFTRSGDDGTYQLAALEPGSYTVRRTLIDPSWRETTAVVERVTVNAGESRTLDFGQAVAGTLAADVFEDLDWDDARDPNERPMAGFRIYSDENENGRFDVGEPAARTDDTGRAVITGVRPGKIVLRATAVSGWRITPDGYTFDLLPTGTKTRAFAVDSRPLLKGIIFYDEDANGRRDGVREYPTLGGNVFIDVNRNGEFDPDDQEATYVGDYRSVAYWYFPELVPGTYHIRYKPEHSHLKLSVPAEREYVVTLGLGQARDDLEFGYIWS